MFPCPRCVWRCKIAFAGVFLVWVIRRPPHGNSQRPLPLHAACSHPSRATRQCTVRRRYSKLPEAFPSFPPLLHTLHACLLHPCPPSVLFRMIAFSLFLPPSMPVTPPECASSAQPWGRIESAVCRSRGAQVPPLTCCGGVLSRVGGWRHARRTSLMLLSRLTKIHSLPVACTVCHQGCMPLNALHALRLSVSVSSHPCDGGTPPFFLPAPLEGASSRGSICAASSASCPPPLLAPPPLVAPRPRCRPAGACCDAAFGMSAFPL
jgi:hypothetical protein